MFRYLCPAAISKTHSCPHFLMKPQKYERVAPYALFDGNHPEIDEKTAKLIWDLFNQGYKYKEMINMYPQEIGTPLQ